MKYHDAIGIHHYPRNEEIESFCGLQAATPSLATDLKSPGISHSTDTAVRTKGDTKSKNTGVTLSDIEDEVTTCRACELHRNRIYPVAGKGGSGGRLLVIGDWLSGDVDGHLPEGRVLGVQQDQMLTRMLAAINLQPDEVFITNVIKCAVPVSCHPAADHVRCCMSFLHRQIVLLAPEVICTMGMIAAKAVLDRSQSLSQLRGTFHIYNTEDGLHIPVLATYHPTYLLQNPEMKKATWADLQLLAKRLKLEK